MVLEMPLLEVSSYSQFKKRKGYPLTPFAVGLNVCESEYGGTPPCILNFGTECEWLWPHLPLKEDLMVSRREELHHPCWESDLN
jgi:hypothetical protein